MNNPHWPYYLTNTLHFTYEGEDLWGTILGFGNDYFKLVTKQGVKNYYYNKISITALYQCAVGELRKRYQYHNDEKFKYLHDYYGPYVPSYPWKED